MNVFSPLVASICFALLVVLAMRQLADAPVRKVITVWTVVGLGAAVLKSLLVQMAPQWTDLPPDSLKYLANAEALHMHWIGMPVDAILGRLDGYVSGYHLHFGGRWLPDSPISYTGVLGTQEWIFSAFLAGCKFAGDGWEHWAIFANAVMAGSFPAATFLLVRHLGGNLKVGHLGAFLVALDPSTAVNSAWFIKDTMAGFIATIVAILICRLYSNRSWQLAIVLGIMLGLLAGIRFVAYISFFIVLGTWGIQQLLQKATQRTVVFGGATVLSVLVWGFIYFTPVIPTGNQLLVGAKSPVQAQVATLKAKKGEQGADKSVIEWRSYLNGHTSLAILRAIARTLMAPYPWVAFTEGITKKNAMELYLPGTLLWIICLPAIFVGMRTSTRQAGAVGRVLLAFLALIACAYIAYFGEWSTRQRVFMIPLFFAFAAIGFDRMWRMKLSITGPSNSSTNSCPQ